VITAARVNNIHESVDYRYALPFISVIIMKLIRIKPNRRIFLNNQLKSVHEKARMITALNQNKRCGTAGKNYNSNNPLPICGAPGQSMVTYTVRVHDT